MDGKGGLFQGLRGIGATGCSKVLLLHDLAAGRRRLR